MTDKIKISELDLLPTVAQDDQIVVLDVDDTSESPEGTTKRANKSELKGLNWQGSWSAGSYITDDAVEHNGSAYVANTDTTEEPGVGSEWDLLASKGDQGDQGDQGDTGISFTYQGAWSAGSYDANDVVVNGGSAWIALQTTTEEPTAVTANWGLMASKGDQGDAGNDGDDGEFINKYQGAWSAGTYTIGQIVTNNGSSWIVTAASTTEEPTGTPTNWDKIADKGTDGAGAVDSVNGEVGVVVLDPDHLDDTSTTNKFTTAGEKAKVGYISVTQAVDLDQMELDIAALDAAVVLKGVWDASVGTFPGGGTAQAGASYIVSVGGTVGGVEFAINDRIVAITDNASTTVYAANWHKLDYTDAVLSVDSQTGAIDLGTILFGKTAKTTPVDADTFTLTDSAASNVLKKVTWANIKVTIKSYYDSVTATLTNKRITKRVGTTTSSATPTINTDSYDVYKITAQAADITSMTTNLSGTPTDRQLFLFEIQGTAARAITWGASFADGQQHSWPTTTVTTENTKALGQWDSSLSKWVCVGLA